MTRPKLTIRRRSKPAPLTEVPWAPITTAVPWPDGMGPPYGSFPPVGLPPVSSVCEPCGVYVIRPEVHADWHRQLDAKAARWDRVRALVLRVFLARGYITTDENTTPANGDT